MNTLDLMYLLIVFLPLLGSSVAGFFGRFLGSEGTAIMTTGRNLVLLAILLFCLIFLFRRYCLRLKNKSGFPLVSIYISISFFISFFFFFLRLYLISHFFLYLKDVFAFVVVFSVGTVITAETEYGKMMMAPSGGSGSSNSTSWTGKASFEERVLIEPFPETDTDSGSVNQPEARPVLPANQVASPGEGAGPSRPFETYPYRPDEVIGGDSVLSIERRLLEKKSSPSAEDIRLAHMKAEDLFEVKVDIIRQMTPLDPEGDWMRRGARALDNPRTATGEESLERLFSLRDELNSQGKQSQAFAHLKSKVLRKWDDADRSSAS